MKNIHSIDQNPHNINATSLHADDILSIQDVSYSYGSKHVLDQVSLHVNEGEILSLIGPNGCGKSTLLKLACGLLCPAAKEQGHNTIQIAGKDIEAYSRKELARTISVLPQSRDIPNITVERLVEHGRFPHLSMSRQLTHKDRTIIDQSIAAVRIEEFRHKNISTLSGGERQRAYIAMVLAQDTPVILMDEPTTYLDIDHQFELMELITTLNKELHKTIVLVLHDIAFAMKYSTHIAVMNHGKILYDGFPEQLICDNANILTDIFHINCHKITLDGQDEYLITPI